MNSPTAAKFLMDNYLYGSHPLQFNDEEYYKFKIIQNFFHCPAGDEFILFDKNTDFMPIFSIDGELNSAIVSPQKVADVRKPQVEMDHYFFQISFQHSIFRSIQFNSNIVLNGFKTSPFVKNQINTRNPRKLNLFLKDLIAQMSCTFEDLLLQEGQFITIF